jgi:predicted dehydrogenase
MLRIGLIGCGAVTERSHVPALLSTGERVKITAAVDRNPARADLISQMSGAKAFKEIADAIPHCDAAIVALPHFLHAPASIQLLSAGKHVLVEKPMALNRAECDAIIAAANNSGAILGVGQMRRFCPAVATAKWLLAGGSIGKILRWKILEGLIYCWPVASDFFFRRETAGGGVLMDTGAHTLDMLLWFFGDVDRFEYRDDAGAGVEADCEIKLAMKNGSVGYVELSRTRNLPGILEVEGAEGRLLLDFSSNRCTVVPSILGNKIFVNAAGDFTAVGADLGAAMFALQLDDWLGAIEQKRPPLATGEEARRVVDFIEKCYAQRQPLTKPWNAVELEGNP